MTTAATTEKKAKRPYIKKTLRTQDELWKVIISTLWAPFFHFCLEDWVDKIDFTREPTFLDKELKRLQLRAKSKNRTVDVLMRVYLKDGTNKVFLLHIEVQGYYDADFRQRVYQYYYRISDLLQEPIETLAILIDDDPNWRPNSYLQVLGQTKLFFEFRMFKLLDNPPPYLPKEDNPFSVVFEVAWYGLKKNMLKNDKDLATLKFRLMRRLLENNVDGDTIYTMLDFINIYLPFKKPEKVITFDREIESLIDKDKKMGAATGTRTMRDLYDDFLRENERKLMRKEFKKEQKIAQKKLEKEQKIAQEKLEKEQKRAQEKLEKEQKIAQEKLEKAELLRQEEARARQEEARARQEMAKGMALLINKLYSQGVSIQSIADTMSQSLDFVHNILHPKEVNG